MFLLIILGSAIFVSISVLHVRKSAFERRLEELAERKRRRLGRTLTFSLSKRLTRLDDQREVAIASGTSRGQPIEDPDPEAEYQPTFATRTRTQSTRNAQKSEGVPNDGPVLATDGSTSQHIAFGSMPQPVKRTTTKMAPLRRRTTALNTGVGTHSNTNHPRDAQPIIYETRSDDEKEPGEGNRLRSSSIAKIDKYIDEFEGFLSRNSQFHHLSERERRALGGMEYDALCVLNWVVPLYFVLFQLLGAVALGAWIQVNHPELALTNGQSS